MEQTTSLIYDFSKSTFAYSWAWGSTESNTGIKTSQHHLYVDDLQMYQSFYSIEMLKAT